MFLRIIATAICGVFCVLIIKDKNPQGAFAVSITVCIVILLEIIPILSSIYKRMQNYMDAAQVDGDIFIDLFRVVIIALATRLISELCRDNGERAIGAKIELAGVAIGLICAMPLIDKALTLIGAL